MTERLTKEAALAMAREVVTVLYEAKAEASMVVEDVALWYSLEAVRIRKGKADQTEVVQSALAAIGAIEARHGAENARLRAAIIEGDDLKGDDLRHWRNCLITKVHATFTDTGAV